MALPYTFRRLPFAVSLPNAPVILASESAPLVPKPAVGVTAYYLFGEDNPGNRDINGANALRRNVIFAKTSGGSGYTTAAVTVTRAGMTGIVANPIIVSGAVDHIILADPGTGTGTGPYTVTVNGDGTGAAWTAVQGAAPLVNPSSISLVGGERNALLTPFPDTTDQTMIIIMKQRKNAASPSGHIIMGTGYLLAAPSPGGDFLFASTSDTTPSMSRVTRSSGGQNPVQNNPPAAIPDQGWMMASLGVTTNAAVGGNLVAFGNGPGSLLTYGPSAGSTKIAATPPRMLAIGPAYYSSSSFWLSLEVAAFAVKTSYMTPAQILAVYERMRSDCAARGITVY